MNGHINTLNDMTLSSLNIYSTRIQVCLSSIVSHQGPNQRRLYNDLMRDYNPLVRPVSNDSQSLTVYFGLSIMQIMDVVS